MSLALDLVILLTSLSHVSVSPYTKVEESFNLHATHDILMYGVGPSNLRKYDHFVFPGAVPRTFVGSVALAWLSDIVLRIGVWFGLFVGKFDMQVIVRMVLASANAVGLIALRRAVSRRFGRSTGFMFVLLSITQFHLPFWMGRTLPNMFALLPANLALYKLIDRAPNTIRPSKPNVQWAIALLTFTTVVFRSELLLLLGPLALQASLRYVSVYDVVKAGFLSGLASAALTVFVDSYFWQQWPLWPELYGIYFNVIQGKSAEWGVEPFHRYFSSYLPKLLLSSLPLSGLGFVLEARVRSLLLPYLMFIGIISGLAHKEWRFVIYVVPAFNIAAARGAAWLVGRRKGSIFGQLCFLAVIGMLVLNAVVTFLSTQAAAANYPGGAALQTFNDHFASEKSVHVHISNLAAQTGASLFLHRNAPPFYPGLPVPPHTKWVYDKTENLSLADLTNSQNATHLIAEASALEGNKHAHGWTPVALIAGFDGWRFHERYGLRAVLAEGLTGLGNMLEMRRSGKLVILARNGKT
ncbi:Alg9-like mannosyltransferase family-domain-containing protein [Dichomitus squalens]|uniref:Mannosyltransferase n=1 Tax=Dichomitus squalens TaxID=114155 RepID=A0A4Q9MDH7_9APHY|nr:Alg9-like mannosyltransferase family-domain-containing protein [Dichomitus squalens]